MYERNTALRPMHDTGLAGWFGGPLMGAVGLGTVDDPVLTGALLVVSSLAGDQQKPGPVGRGVGARVRQFPHPVRLRRRHAAV